MSKTCLLLSGGMDSSALAFWLRPDFAITIDYGQRCAEAEVNAAKTICQELGIEHHLIQVDCSTLGSGDLTDRPAISIAPESDWWPYRNQLLITLCASKVLQLGAEELIVGAVASDSFHRDGTKKFFEIMALLFQYQEGGLRLSIPAINLTTYELIEQSKMPLELLGWTHSCHKSNVPCSSCRGCFKHSGVMQKVLRDV